MKLLYFHLLPNCSISLYRSMQPHPIHDNSLKANSVTAYTHTHSIFMQYIRHSSVRQQTEWIKCRRIKEWNGFCWMKWPINGQKKRLNNIHGKCCGATWLQHNQDFGARRCELSRAPFILDGMAANNDEVMKTNSFMFWVWGHTIRSLHS